MRCSRPWRVVGAAQVLQVSIAIVSECMSMIRKREAGKEIESKETDPLQLSVRLQPFHNFPLTRFLGPLLLLFHLLFPFANNFVWCCSTQRHQNQI